MRSSNLMKYTTINYNHICHTIDDACHMMLVISGSSWLIVFLRFNCTFNQATKIKWLASSNWIADMIPVLFSRSFQAQADKRPIIHCTPWLWRQWSKRFWRQCSFIYIWDCTNSWFIVLKIVKSEDSSIWSHSIKYTMVANRTRLEAVHMWQQRIPNVMAW